MRFDPHCFGVLFPRRSVVYGSPVVVFLDRGHPCLQNFFSTFPVDVVRVKSYA